MSDEEQYIKGFNNAYILAEHEPSLLDTITKGLTPTTEYLGGFLDGKEQFEIDHTRNQLSELDALRNKSHERGRELERED